MILERRDVLRKVRDWPAEKVVAHTLYGEIRGHTRAQVLNVAMVIRNRVRGQINADATKPDWWGEGWTGVSLARAQFSCWWDAQQEKLLSDLSTDQEYLRLLSIAREVIAWRDPDPTQSATHYHTPAVSPNWGAILDHKTIEDGAHIFYRDPAVRFPEDLVAAVHNSTPNSAPGPWAVITSGGLVGAIQWLGTLSPDQATGWWGFARPILVFVLDNWFKLGVILGLTIGALGVRWLIMRWRSQQTKAIAL